MLSETFKLNRACADRRHAAEVPPLKQGLQLDAQVGDMACRKLRATTC